MLNGYSEKEICGIYNRAYEHQDRIKLLKELTMLDKETIIDILKKHGIKVALKRTRIKINREKVLELYKQNLNNAEIAKEMCISESSVSFILKEYGLYSNYKK